MVPLVIVSNEAAKRAHVDVGDASVQFAADNCAEETHDTFSTALYLILAPLLTSFAFKHVVV